MVKMLKLNLSYNTYYIGEVRRHCWVCWQPSGKGTERRSVGSGYCSIIYVGNWSKGKRHGQGKSFDKDGEKK